MKVFFLEITQRGAAPHLKYTLPFELDEELKETS